jgi:Protein of unknown function (DUF3048) N-terminal domain/Protein of unknown function (DUF3048) C-terminal domain
MNAWTPVIAGVLVAGVLAACTPDADQAQPEAPARRPPASPAPQAPATETAPPRLGSLALTVSAGGPPASLVGLDRARTVVEYPVDADRTGLFVVLDTDAGVVGPLRSATPSDAALALAFDADLVTGSTTTSVVDQLRQADLSVVEEFGWPQTLVRDPARRAPFNLYAVPSRIRAAVGERPPASGWPAGSGDVSAPRSQSEVQVTTASDVVVTWTWDPAARRWLRTMAGRLEQSATGERVGADIIAVLEVPVRDRPPVVADLLGSGSALVLRDGTVATGRWQRDNESALPTIHGLGPSVPARGTLWLHVCASPCVPVAPSPATPSPPQLQTS